MRASDIVSVVSLLVISSALFLNFLQVRELTKQTQEIAKQALISSFSARQGSYQGMMNHVLDFTYNAMVRDPDLLSWFLDSRGFPNVSESERCKYLFLWMVRQTEARRAEGIIAEPVWLYWRRAVQYDVETPEFETVWQTVGDTFTSGFVDCINELRATSPRWQPESRKQDSWLPWWARPAP